MAESELLLSPNDDSNAVELSQKVYRKRILPKATITYRGRKITFDDAYLNDLATSYKDGAYDQVAFMLADSQNTHTLDPERFRGEIKDVEVADDGLYAKIAVTPQMAEALEQNPKLGVSARILENYERSDGKHFPRALQHVLGTLDPVIPGLGTWEEVALSNGIDPDNVIDLSASSYEELEQMATRADYLKQVAEATDMTVEDVEALGMTDEELSVFASAFQDVSASDDPDGDELIEEPGQEELEGLTDDASDDLPSEEDIEAAVSALSDEELAALAAELDIDTEDTEDTGVTAETDTAAETGTGDEAEATAATEAETTVEAVTEEPTDTELADRLGTGEFESGLGDTSVDGNLPELSDEELAAMQDLWTAAYEKDQEASTTSEATETDETVPAAETQTEAEVEVETPQEPVLTGAVTLSNEHGPEVVALSNQVADLQQRLAQQEFDTLKSEYVRKGVPAALVDLARPVLLAGQALEFSNTLGERVDPAHVVRQLLNAATGYIDLARERGHSYAPDADDQAAMQAAEDKRLASLWSEQYDRI